MQQPTNTGSTQLEIVKKVLELQLIPAHKKIVCMLFPGSIRRNMYRWLAKLLSTYDDNTPPTEYKEKDLNEYEIDFLIELSVECFIFYFIPAAHWPRPVINSFELLDIRPKKILEMFEYSKKCFNDKLKSINLSLLTVVNSIIVHNQLEQTSYSEEEPIQFFSCILNEAREKSGWGLLKINKKWDITTIWYYSRFIHKLTSLSFREIRCHILYKIGDQMYQTRSMFELRAIGESLFYQLAIIEKHYKRLKAEQDRIVSRQQIQNIEENYPYYQNLEIANNYYDSDDNSYSEPESDSELNSLAEMDEE